MAMTHATNYQVDVRNRPEFLKRILRSLVGGVMSLEGDLSRCKFRLDVVNSRNETETLKRATLWPKQDFVTIALKAGFIDHIFKEVMSAGLKQAIIHVQIERDGELQLGAYDNFHAECVVVSGAISKSDLDQWKAEDVIREYHPVSPQTPPATSV